MKTEAKQIVTNETHFQEQRQKIEKSDCCGDEIYYNQQTMMPYCAHCGNWCLIK